MPNKKTLGNEPIVSLNFKRSYNAAEIRYFERKGNMENILLDFTLKYSMLPGLKDELGNLPIVYTIENDMMGRLTVLLSMNFISDSELSRLQYIEKEYNRLLQI